MRDTMDLKDKYLITIRKKGDELWLTGRGTLIEARKEVKRLQATAYYKKVHIGIMRLHLWANVKCLPGSENGDFTCFGRDLAAAVESEMNH